MANCLRGGKSYKRHQYCQGITEVDGTTLETIICKACGKQKVKKIKLDNITKEG
jgi:hypothetical protein